jgi:anaerobic magnesium-protoporphyrin IX monomethyl ester cyclase
MARAHLIYGCPTENWQTIQETIDLIYALKPLSIVLYILDLFQGTKLYEDFKVQFNASDVN